MIPAEDLFPDVFDSITGPAVGLQGMRKREQLTQKALAAMVGMYQHHLSEMENGKRPIGRMMARKLGKALRCDYRVFL